jgi:hypothetical protein
VNLLLIGRIVHLVGAGRIMSLGVTENIVHLMFEVMLPMVVAGVKEDIK